MRTWAFIVLIAAITVPACGSSASSGGPADAGPPPPDTGTQPPTCTNAGCDDGNPCNGTETCGAAGTCAAGTPLADGTACGTDKECLAGACVVTASVCGNGRLDPGEECDDGNTVNLDGCDSACKLEQDARVTDLMQQFAPDQFCTRNVFGLALTAAAQQTIQQTWQDPVSTGAQNIVFKFVGTNGALGPSSSESFSLGFVNATPFNVDPNNPPANYDGTNDLDWWYIVDPASVDTTGNPTIQLPANVSDGHISAGPGKITLNLLFALSPATVDLFNTKVDATFDPTLGKPTISTDGSTPGHRTSEHLNPNLQTYISSSAGEMCSDVGAQSLFNTPIPTLLQAVCQADNPMGGDPISVFTTDNTLLDVFVHGCSIFDNPAAQVQVTQPDGSLDGSTYQFGFDPVTLKTATCTKDGQPADLDECLANATFSSAFTFTSDRVIIRTSGT